MVRTAGGGLNRRHALLPDTDRHIEERCTARPRPVHARPRTPCRVHSGRGCRPRSTREQSAPHRPSDSPPNADPRKREDMHSNLIVARMDAASGTQVARLFEAFDNTDMPHRMGTRRRQLFQYRGLYFHLQDFDADNGGELIEEAKSDPRFLQISDDLKPHIEAYDPATWRSPADAMAKRFYDWTATR
uniref:Polyketide cyclase n=1 Tax=Streptomyces griseus TaxID=1911 RepID=A0A513TZM5_STRGR|nr:polyketide cyclase [Streptomyces griseus]